jgi:glycosyltransferase involved in cell wall biosynthesis
MPTLANGEPRNIVVNIRTLAANLTGVQRYAGSILELLSDRVALVQPKPNSCGGLRGHVWEQTSLPFQTGGRLLWSPGNTGPLAVEKQVVSIMDASALDHPEWFSPNFAAWYRFIIPRIARRARKVITISEFSRTRLVEMCGIDSSKIAVTPLGYSGAFHPATPEAIADVGARYRLPKRYVVYVGSIEPRKNLARLVEAWTRLGDIDCALVMVGVQGRIFSDLNMPESSQRILQLGRVPDRDLPALYSGALFFVYPSLYEGFGLPPLEAMACGCPVIVSHATSLPEVCGDAALYFNPESVEDIAEKLSAALSDESLLEDLRKRTLPRAHQFSWGRCADETFSILSEAND